MPLTTPGRKLRVLVAEDEPLAAVVVEEILRDQGHDVLLAADGAAAFALAQQESFDVLVTDLAMPRMPGWELIPLLRAQRPHLPVVVMTGFLPPGIDATLEGAGPGPLVLLQKPFDLGSLLEAVETVGSGAPCLGALSAPAARAARLA